MQRLLGNWFAPVEMHLNPKSGNWIPDNSRFQRHVSLAIAYNVWRYYQITNDYEFLYFYGAEIIMDIAKFWASKVEWSEEKERYEIKNVMGPDEYHTAYPGSDELGINNNAYTNVLVKDKPYNLKPGKQRSSSCSRIKQR